MAYFDRLRSLRVPATEGLAPLDLVPTSGTRGRINCPGRGPGGSYFVFLSSAFTYFSGDFVNVALSSLLQK